MQHKADSTKPGPQGIRSENRAKPEKLTVYYYNSDPDQWERDLVAFRKERGEYD